MAMGADQVSSEVISGTRTILYRRIGLRDEKSGHAITNSVE